ncbi:hypothetical protein LFM09_35190 [Lentzea alba]|uniref:hypothetical protein n=1 Tax=Lentzea alba TaxID=2714351 RepID=UPI0039BF46C8
MNRRAYLCLLAAGTLAVGTLTACGQPPSPGTPRAELQAEVTTTTTTPTTAQVATPAPPPPPTTTTPPPPKPPPPRTTTKPPPPPPKPPDRWALPSGLRTSIEQRDEQQFPDIWAGMTDELANACPGKKLCVGYALVVDPSVVDERNCFVPDKGISVPDPLREGGKITFKVNNKTDCVVG